MARIGGVTKKSIDKFIRKLEKTSENLQKDVQNKLLFEIRGDTEMVMDNHREDFILPPDRIPEFGVGEGGQPDEHAAANAWKAMLPNPEGGGPKVTQINFKKQKGVFGFQFLISDKFYEIDGVTSYLNLSYNSFGQYAEMEALMEEINEPTQPDVIPWMKWYIEGHDTEEYSLVTGEDLPGSRTGKALMAPISRTKKPFWHTDKRPTVWPSLNLDLQKQLERTVRKFMKKYKFKF